MKKIYFAIVAIMLWAGSIKAQTITPTNLFQLDKYWQMDDPKYYKYTYKYLMTVDNHWTTAIPPDEKDGLILVFCYKPDSTHIYKAHECELTWINDKSSAIHKCILYSFTDVALWNTYNQQMQAMNANRMAEGSYNGGHQTIYKVNDLTIFLREFPPGVNGDDKVYQVQVGRDGN